MTPNQLTITLNLDSAQYNFNKPLVFCLEKRPEY